MPGKGVWTTSGGMNKPNVDVDCFADVIDVTDVSDDDGNDDGDDDDDDNCRYD